MTDIVFYFQAHQPYRLRQIRHEPGESAQRWFDDELNKFVVERVAERCYRPMNALLLELKQRHGERFRVALSLSGTLIRQLRDWSPRTLDSFVALADADAAEFLCETSCHSISSLGHPEEFEAQVLEQCETVTELFGRRPTTFRNTELILRNDIARKVEQLGFDLMLGEGADRLLDWRKPFWLYRPKDCERLRLMLRCYPLSDDIGFRFSNRKWEEYPLTADKFAKWIHALPSEAALVGLFMDYETFGEHQWADTGILEFMRHLPEEVLKLDRFRFRSPAVVAADNTPVADLSIPDPISWADAERDVSAWLGNPMQRYAHDSLYALREQVLRLSTHTTAGAQELVASWRRLTTSDHVYYMATKRASDNDVHEYFSPYGRPHDAFMTFMNVLDDLEARVRRVLAATPVFPPNTAPETDRRTS